MILRFDPTHPESDFIVKAANIVSQGGTVIFPTETVYGIGADLRVPEAIKTVFLLKHRPLHQSLLVHCSRVSQLTLLVTEISPLARLLMEKFWPGSLCLVFKANPALPPTVIGPGHTVGIRMVAHPVTCALIDQIGSPLAGTSANLHGQPATSDPSRLDQNLLSRVDVVLDSGICGTGKASTILDVTVEPPRLVRLGAVSLREIEAVIGYRLPVNQSKT